MNKADKLGLYLAGHGVDYPTCQAIAQDTRVAMELAQNPTDPKGLLDEVKSQCLQRGLKEATAALNQPMEQILFMNYVDQWN